MNSVTLFLFFLLGCVGVGVHIRSYFFPPLKLLFFCVACVLATGLLDVFRVPRIFFRVVLFAIENLSFCKMFVSFRYVR